MGKYIKPNRNSYLSVLFMLVGFLGIVGCAAPSDDDEKTPSASTTISQPSTVIRPSIVYSGAVCANGGITIESGIDDNGNGLLDTAEVDNTQTVCHGEDGSDGDDGMSAFIGGHGDQSAEAFTYWNGTGAVWATCAKCHSEGGFHDFIGADGTAAGSVEDVAETGKTLTCTTCHNGTVKEITSVEFESGVDVPGTSNRGVALGGSTVCLICHQGTKSKTSVDDHLVENDATADPDQEKDLSFQDVHYSAAGATMYGSFVGGGYEYAEDPSGDSLLYDGRLAHVAGRDSCTTCHDMHTLSVKKAACSNCHADATTDSGMAAIRMFGSTGDYDGDSNTTEGIKNELEGLAATLNSVIKAYATNVSGSDIVYAANAQPGKHFVKDANGNGVADSGEAKYDAWTGRLMKAAYNYQFYKKDPGSFAHNPKYMIELLHDSIDDLNAGLVAKGESPIAFAGDREDAGHFSGGASAWGNGYFNKTVRSGCVKCHSGSGFRDFAEDATIDTATHYGTNGLMCSACHDDVGGVWTDLVAVDSITFPGANAPYAGFDTTNDAICATCHMGRESKKTVDDALEALSLNEAGDVDTTSDSLGYMDAHYFAVAAVLAGTDAGVGYEYPTKTYTGRFSAGSHAAAPRDACVFCHDPAATKHSMDAMTDNAATCAQAGCHDGTSPSISSIKTANTADLDSLSTTLLSAMQTYATGNGFDIAYDSQTYPYFFGDTNGNGVVDATTDEASFSNSYGAWTPRLLKAAFNYQIYQKEPGAWAHNFDYMFELLYDSVEDVGGVPDVSSDTRP
ncbi:MAG: hypothetical protein GY866_27725 [Proteobacteria bacterium]|nr:hypothetical protein [Pseudomonadota bacterium]